MVSCASCGFSVSKKQKEDSVTFHRFPKDQRRRAAWIQFMKNPEFVPKIKSFLCSHHFADNCFDRTSRLQVRLHPNAVPTIEVDRLKYVKIYNPIVTRHSQCENSALMDHDYVYSIAGASSIAGPSQCMAGPSGIAGPPFISEPRLSVRELTPTPCDDIPPANSEDTPRKRVLKERIKKLEHREILYRKQIKHLQKINGSMKKKMSSMKLLVADLKRKNLVLDIMKKIKQ